MDQGWKRLPLLVIFLLFWRSADGFRGGARSNAHNLWGLPPDTHSPRAVQSSMPEARATGTLPVEEVGSSLFPSRPLKSRSKFNLTQFVKGGSVSSQSTSHAQTAPSSSVSAALLLPVAAQPSSSLTSSGSTFQGAASGVSSQTQYAASGSGPVVSTQGESSSYPAKLVVSGQSTSDSLPVSSSLESSGLQSAGASLSVFSQESISQSSSSAPGAVSISQSSPVLLESMGQPVSSQGEGSSSGLSQGASSQYTPDSNAKLSSSTFSSQSTGDQSSPSLGSSSQGSSGMFLVSGSSLLAEATGLGPLDSSKSPETSSQLLPMPLISSQSTSSQSSPSLLTVVPQSSSESKLTDAASSLYSQGSGSYSSLYSQAVGSATSQSSSGAELSPNSLHSIPAQVGTDSYSGVPQSLSASSLYTPVSLVSNKLDALPLEVSSQSTSGPGSPSVSVSSTQLATSSSYVPVQGGSSSLSLSPGTLSAPMSAPQAIYSQTTGSGSSYGAVSRFGSLSQTGASGQFTSQGGNYYLKPISSPQSTSSQATSVLSSRKQYTTASQGSSGAQFGASQGLSSSYSGSVLSQGTTSQFAPGADSLSTTVQSSRKQFVSSYGTQSGSSAPFTLQGSLAYAGSPQAQGTASQLVPGYASGSLSSPQTVAGPTAAQSSQKQFTSTFTDSSGTQAGSSTLFTLQGSTAYSGSPQPQGTTSQFAPGSQPSYAGVSLSSPQAVAGPTIQSSRKQFTSASQGSSGAQFGASTGFASQGMSSSYSGSVQSQGTASQFAPGYAGVSLSSPQAGPSTNVLGSQKLPTSTYMGSSGTQAGSSTPFTLQGSTAYGGSQPQDTTSQFGPGSSSPYASVSLSSPQAVAGPTMLQSSQKQFTSTFTGSSGAQFGAATGFASEGASSRYSGSVQSQGTASRFAPGYAGGSLSSPQTVAGPTTVQSSQKQFTSTFTGSSGTQAGSSTRFSMQGSTAYGSPPSQGTTSQFAPGSQSSYAGVLLSSPQAVVGPTTVQSSRKQLASTFTGSSGAQFGASTGFASGVSSRYSGSVQSQGTASQFAPGYASVPLSLPQVVAGPTTVQSSRKQLASTFTGSSGAQFGPSTGFASGVSSRYSGSVQSQGTASQFAPGYASVPLSPPQAVAGPTTAQSSWKQFTPASQGSSRAQFGASTGFASQGMSSFYSGSVQSQGTTSQFAPGSPSYAGVSLSSPQAGPSAAVQGSLKRPTSTYMGSSGTQAGSSTLLALQGSTTYGASQPQGTTSQFAPGSSPYASVSLSSPQGVAGSTAVQSSRKQLASTFTGSSGAQFGASTGFASGVSSRYSGSVQSQGTASQFAPGSPSYAGVSLSSPQAGPSAAVQGSLKRPTSTYMGSSGTQAGSSTLLALQGSTTYGGSQPQGTTSQFAPGSSPYASVSLPSPQAVAGPATVQSSRKQSTSASQGSSGAQFGASTGFASEGVSSRYSGSVQSQGTASQFAPGSQGKQFTFRGSSGTQTGSSTLFTLQGSTAYGGSPQPQDAASEFAPGSQSSYESASLSSPQGVAGQPSQAYQSYSVSQSQKSQRWQPSATRWIQSVQTSDAAASQGSSSQSSPILSSSGVSGQFVSAQGGGASYGGSFRSQSLSTKYTPGSQLYDPNVASQGTSSASAAEFLSGYSSMYNQNAPAQPSHSSSSSRFYSGKLLRNADVFQN